MTIVQTVLAELSATCQLPVLHGPATPRCRDEIADTSTPVAICARTAPIMNPLT